jgi:hypothetical protein
MNFGKYLGLVLALAIPAAAGSKPQSAQAKEHGFHMVRAKQDPWSYAGEDHGIRFFFKTEQVRGKDRMRLKLENTSDAPVDVAFRVMDMDWHTRLANSLAARGTDSSLVVRLQAGREIRYPYFDEVFLWFDT